MALDTAGHQRAVAGDRIDPYNPCGKAHYHELAIRLYGNALQESQLWPATPATALATAGHEGVDACRRVDPYDRAEKAHHHELAILFHGNTLGRTQEWPAARGDA
jgi:hypothetical protein